MRIDTHVHCRDGEQSHKGTIKRTFEIAREAGIDVIFDMAANTDPPTIHEINILVRLFFVPSDCLSRYFLWMGLTTDTAQIQEAVYCWKTRKHVIGLKMFATDSGAKELAIREFAEQESVYQSLVRNGFTGVLAVHCEKDSFLKPDQWNPFDPISHSKARPPEAEIESVADQIKLLEKTGFMGTLQICHVSCPESVALVTDAKRRRLKVVCEVTPHHLFFDEKKQKKNEVALYKVNPPLRDFHRVEQLRACVLRGEIDYIGTDHAPHELAEKMFSFNPPSGISSLRIYRELVDVFLPGHGASPELIKAMTSRNIIKTFGAKLAKLTKKEGIA